MPSDTGTQSEGHSPCTSDCTKMTECLHKANCNKILTICLSADDTLSKRKVFEEFKPSYQKDSGNWTSSTIDSDNENEGSDKENPPKQTVSTMTMMKSPGNVIEANSSHKVPDEILSESMLNILHPSQSEESDVMDNEDKDSGIQGSDGNDSVEKSISSETTLLSSDTTLSNETFPANSDMAINEDLSVENGDEISDDEIKENQAGIYKVEKIVDYRRDGNNDLYYVKWVGWDSSDNTWEPLSNLDNCDEVLVEFFTSRREENVDRKRKLLEPPDPRGTDDIVKDYIENTYQSTKEELVQMLRRTLEKNKKSHVKKLSDKAFKAMVLEAVRNNKKPKVSFQLTTLKEQILLRELDKLRTEQLLKLKEWKESICEELTLPDRIMVENNVDLEGPPESFIYVNDYVVLDDSIKIPTDPLVGCECSKCGYDKKTQCCGPLSESLFAFDIYGRIKVKWGTPIYECNKRCTCDHTCPNRIVQKGQKVKLCIFRTSNGCGWGVRTMETIKKNSFVTEYVGEVITSAEADLRGKKYDREGRTYLFDLDYNEGDGESEGCAYTVDAAIYGNVSHFINHSCEPNLAVYAVWIDCLDPNLPKLALFATRDIKKGEEITFDYSMSQALKCKGESQESDSLKPVSSCLNGLPKTECKCGSANCRKYLF